MGLRSSETAKCLCATTGLSLATDVSVCRAQETRQAAFNFVIEMAQVAAHERVTSMVSYVIEWLIKLYNVKGNDNSCNICMQTTSRQRD